MAEENILIHHGGMVNNDFVQILKLKLPEIFEITSFISSPYYSFDNLITTLKDKEKHFTVLSLNCQSLNAKLDALVVFIEELRLHHFEFSAICLQETWLSENSDLSVFQLHNYTCISQSKYCSNHGGLIIYLHQNFSIDTHYVIPNSNIWEGLFIKIPDTSLNTQPKKADLVIIIITVIL